MRVHCVLVFIDRVLGVQTHRLIGRDNEISYPYKQGTRRTSTADASTIS